LNILACKLIFHANSIGTRDLSDHIGILRGTQFPNPELPELRRVVSLGPQAFPDSGVEIQPYTTFTSTGNSLFMSDAILQRAEERVNREDVVNLQFTSGE
jgi:hypothetical protein